jgi:hypothetical protein
MQTPDHQTSQPRGLGFLGNQVANAALIEAPGVVHDEDVAWRCALQRLKKDIDASGMPGGTDPPRYLAPGDDSMQERRSAANGNRGP